MPRFNKSLVDTFPPFIDHCNTCQLVSTRLRLALPHRDNTSNELYNTNICNFYVDFQKIINPWTGSALKPRLADSPSSSALCQIIKFVNSVSISALQLHYFASCEKNYAHKVWQFLHFFVAKMCTRLSKDQVMHSELLLSTIIIWVRRISWARQIIWSSTDVNEFQAFDLTGQLWLGSIFSATLINILFYCYIGTITRFV